MKPIILITPSIVEQEKFLRVSRAYSDAIEAAGGFAVILDITVVENIPRILKAADGVLLSGGVDIDPFFFGEEPIREIGEITPERDAYELELVRRAAAVNMPILAICRGAQLLNVAFGGKVYQDIYSQIKTPVIKHSQQMPGQNASHSVKISGGTILRRIFNRDEIRVNSFHHQAASVLGDRIVLSAAACDGVAEAIEHKDKEFCVGVQWHPELMYKKENGQLEIFREFISAAKNNMLRKV